MHPRVNDTWGRHCVDWFGTPIDRRQMDTVTRRISPSSLRETLAHRSSWMLRTLSFCPITMELLISNCPTCLKRLGWRACRAIWKCDKCGASLLEAEAPAVPESYLHSARLAANLVSEVAGVRLAALAELPEPFLTWVPGDVLDAAAVLGKANLALKGVRGVAREGASAQEIAVGFEFLQGWPETLVTFSREATNLNRSASFIKGHGSLGKYFYSSAPPNPLRDLLRTSIPSAMNEANVPIRVSARSVSAGGVRTKTLTALEARRELGVAQSTLRRLEGRSPVFATRIRQARGATTLYNAAGIRRLSHSLRMSVKSEQCAKLLGIPNYCIPSVLGAELIKSVADVDVQILTESTRIERSSIDVLSKDLIAKSIKIEGGVTLKSQMQGQTNPEIWPAALLAILKGDLAVQAIEGEPLAVSERLLVRSEEISAFSASVRTSSGVPNIEISCLEAGDILGATGQFVAAATRAGLIEGEIGFPRSNVKLWSVEQFRRYYILPRELSKMLNCSSKSARGRLSAAGFDPKVCVERVNVWLRSDVASFLEKCDAL